METQHEQKLCAKPSLRTANHHGTQHVKLPAKLSLRTNNKGQQGHPKRHQNDVRGKPLTIKEKLLLPNLRPQTCMERKQV